MTTMNRLLLGALAGIAGTFAMTSAARAMHRRLPAAERYPLPPREIIEGTLPGVTKRALDNFDLLNGALTYVGLLIFDVKYSLVLALVAALLSLIPIFGTILSTVPIVLAASLSSGSSGYF